MSPKNENTPSGSIFLQTDPNYIQYAHIVRNVMILALNAEKIIQNRNPNFQMSSVLFDDELYKTGTKEGAKRLVGFNFTRTYGFEYFIMMSVCYLVAKYYNLTWYFDGYKNVWGNKSHLDAFKANITRTLEKLDQKAKANCAMSFWEVRDYFDKQFKSSVF